MEPVRFGLIGCGEIAVSTATEIGKSRLARIVHCMDVAKDLAADLASRHQGAQASDRVETLLADQAVEAVIVSTPHYLHEPLTLKALAAGKHVLTEKPIACTLAQADRMIAAADQAGLTLGVLYPVRLAWPWRRAAELVADGAIGKVMAVRSNSNSAKPESYWHGGYSGRHKDDWRVSVEKSGGGFLIMNVSHSLDALIAVLDPRPTRVYAEYATLATDVEVEDVATLVMRTADGAIWTADGSSHAIGRESQGDRIYGTKGQLQPVWNGLRVFLSEPHGEIKAEEWVTLPMPEGEPDSRQLMVEGFAQALRSGAEPPCSGRQARRTLEIIRGAYLSMRRGRPVTFPVEE